MKTTIQAAIIVILFIGLNGYTVHTDGDAVSTTQIEEPLPWITQTTPGRTQFQLINLVLDLFLITFMSEFFVYGTTRM